MAGDVGDKLSHQAYCGTEKNRKENGGGIGEHDRPRRRT
jgi:hypothetical protein